ncbi:MAG: glycosyltransferase family 2 protein [Dehalococcoidia bacterium]|nr:glycosyltransferase family 2 protein [Dehalococcoidia bacterium]
MAIVDIVIPVYNEEHVLEESINTLREFLQAGFKHEWKIVVANNASTDGTLALAQKLANKYPDVGYVHLDQKGRGRALRKAWLESKADVVSYMDVDLSTELAAFPPLVDSLLNGYDVAIGSRLSAKSRTTRSLKREFISRCYNLLIQAMFFTNFVDAQCGFKGVTRRAADQLVPLIKDQAWFFDSELLLLAVRKGYRIKVIPVLWVEDTDTRVKIFNTAMEDIKGLLRMRFGPTP